MGLVELDDTTTLVRVRGRLAEDRHALHSTSGGRRAHPRQCAGQGPRAQRTVRKAAERGRILESGQTGFEAGAYVGPFVDEDREDDGVAKSAVGAPLVSAQHALAGRAELRDRCLRAMVD